MYQNTYFIKQHYNMENILSSKENVNDNPNDIIKTKKIRKGNMIIQLLNVSW